MRNYKLFGKIPIFDIIVIVIVAALVLVGAKVFLSSKSGQTVSNSEIKTIRYTVEFQNVSKMVDGIPDAGEKVRDTQTSAEVGTVVFAESKPYTVTTHNVVTGEAVTSVLEDRQNIEVVIETSATVSDSGISVNGVRFGMGRTFEISMPSITGVGIVKNIEEVEV